MKVTLSAALLSLCCLMNAQAQDITLTGSSTVAPLALEIGKAYEARYDVRVNVQTGGSTRGILDARRQLSDFGMVSRGLKRSEQDLKAITIALDGICLIVHGDNPIKSLTEQQIQQIYTGAITNWSEVGGKAQPITVVNKAEGRSTLELFLQHFSLKNSQVKAHVVIGDNQQGLKTVIGNQGAIAYTSIGAAEYEASVGSPVKRLPLNGVAATSENVKNGSYQLARPLNLVQRKNAQDASRDFISFAQSKAILPLIKAQYLVAPNAPQ